jgi:hypothetical protein
MRLFPAECSAGLGYRSGTESGGPARFGRLSMPPREDSGIFDRITVLFVLSLVMCVGISLLGASSVRLSKTGAVAASIKIRRPIKNEKMTSLTM